MPAKLPYLPEMREEEAPAVINCIYADIKNASGTSLVNLIHRHLATIPGGIEWVWGRPPCANGPTPRPTLTPTVAPPNCQSGCIATIGIDLMAA